MSHVLLFPMKRFLLLLTLALGSCTSTTSPLAPQAMATNHGSIGAVEGPAWKNGSLYFTDGKHINRLGPDGKTRVFRHNASNGLLFDHQGLLVACESKDRRVTRTEHDGSITVLADRYRGSRFNSPNDLCTDSKGRVYFTDPRYGPRDNMEIWETPMDSLVSASLFGSKVAYVEGVYRINRPAYSSKTLVTTAAHDIPNVTRIYCDGAERPNGILISPDDRYLYIADNNNNTHGGSRRLLRYALDNQGEVKLRSMKVIFDWKDGRGPDGMKMDRAGRLYVAAGTNKPTEYETTRFQAGCYILSPLGKLLAFIPTSPDECCNCAFGGADGRTLFVTSGGNLWSVPLK